MRLCLFRVKRVGMIEPAGFDLVTSEMGRRNSMAHRQKHNLQPPAEKETIGRDEQGVSRLALKAGEGRLDFAASAGVEDSNLQSEGACRLWYVSQRGLGSRSVRRINQNGDTSSLGHQLMQKPQPLGVNFTVEEINAGCVAARPRQAGNETEFDRVVSDAEDDRDRWGRRFPRECCGGLPGVAIIMQPAPLRNSPRSCRFSKPTR
jgi:hypothetical protein